ncbi:hypothetical protein Y919_10300 [Caloranaerobacter azorensis H53214]|uniref:Uncharacterized protein n=1 Tax=Caloranaerobacter azorensis H53214 TaxID=1156417 RepID=A0A096BG58_9FIRM|nr:hypothetical protein [Caloranaerobacter azorensis]KGG79713.1 hypothetical protein Y919_10300 [Caloranaerobacter azorensis H53214]
MTNIEEFLNKNNIIFEEKRIKIFLKDGSIIVGNASDYLEERLGETPEDILNIENPEIIKNNGIAEIYKEKEGVSPVFIKDIKEIELI